jgi:hypothetical protein
VSTSQANAHLTTQRRGTTAKRGTTRGGDTATAAVKGYAYNVLDEDLGGGMWEVWGAYKIPLRRSVAGWRASGITFRVWHSRGDDSVRTHMLSS